MYHLPADLINIYQRDAPNHLKHDSKVSLILGVDLVCLALSGIAVALRLIEKNKKRALWADDWLLVLAWVISDPKMME